MVCRHNSSERWSRLDIPRTNIWYPLVKFDSDKLPPIFNALNTENNGQKLVLEVAVCLIAELG